MIILAWNCRGISQSTTIQSLREYNLSHRPDVLFLSEIKSSRNVYIMSIVSALGFHNFYLVLVVGCSGGLLLLWKEEFDIHIIAGSTCLINCLVSDPKISTP